MADQAIWFDKDGLADIHDLVGCTIVESLPLPDGHDIDLQSVLVIERDGVRQVVNVHSTELGIWLSEPRESPRFTSAPTGPEVMTSGRPDGVRGHVVAAIRTRSH